MNFPYFEFSFAQSMSSSTDELTSFFTVISPPITFSLIVSLCFKVKTKERIFLL